MSPTTTDRGPSAATVRWLRGLWKYYRGYTHTAIHAVATAALTAVGLLVFVDPLFALLAIASYCFPPIVLYHLDADVGKPAEPAERPAASADPEPRPAGDARAGSDGDADTDSDDGDADSDSDDGDADSDR